MSRRKEERKTHILISNISRASKTEQNRLIKVLRSSLIVQQATAENPHRRNPLVPDLRIRLDAAAAETRRHYLRSVDLCVFALPRIANGPVYRVSHHFGGGAALLTRPAGSDGEVPIRCDLL